MYMWRKLGSVVTPSRSGQSTKIPPSSIHCGPITLNSVALLVAVLLISLSLAERLSLDCIGITATQL